MTTSYSETPAGGLLNIPPSIPNAMLYRCRTIQGLNKQTLKLVPNNGQGTVSQGQKIIVNLPENSLVDLSTFEMNFTGETQHRGNGADTNCANYVQKAYFPRNTASLIENLEIKINGQSRQNINQYGYLFNILYDYTCGTDAGVKQIGCNSDPSNKTVYVGGKGVRYAGYPLGCTTDTTGGGALDRDTYTIRQWLGLLGGNASTNIIDTSLYGQISIEITLAPSDVLMLSAPVGTLVSYASTTNTEINLSTTVGAAVGPVTSPLAGTGYTLSKISFQIVRYDLPDSYFGAVASVLQAGSIFKLYYPNYSTYMGQTVSDIDKTSYTRINLSTQSLDMIISTFQVQDRGVNQAPILGPMNSNYTSLPTGAVGEFGTYAKSFQWARMLGTAKLLNNSKYFVRNGDGVLSATYVLGAVRLISETIPEQFNGVLRAFNAQVDLLGGIYPGIQSLYHYQSQFYSHILSCNSTTEHDIYTVSGLNCSSNPVSIGWDVTGTSAANIDNASPSNGNIYATGAYKATPLMYACFTSRLEVSAGQNIIMIS